MVLSTTLWTVDTCSCQLEFISDPDLLTDPVLSRYIIRCQSHIGLSNDSTRWTTILNENPRKGISLLLCLANGPSTLYNIDPDNGNRVLKPNIKYNFSWSGTSPNRVLNISFTGITLTTQQKSTIQSAINTKLGSGKVVLT